MDELDGLDQFGDREKPKARALSRISCGRSIAAAQVSVDWEVWYGRNWPESQKMGKLGMLSGDSVRHLMGFGFARLGVTGIAKGAALNAGSSQSHSTEARPFAPGRSA
jgi:hypothetical protein